MERACKNCKHWGDETVSWMPSGMKRCEAINPDAGHLACIDNPSFATEDATLFTDPMFSCALFLPKD